MGFFVGQARDNENPPANNNGNKVKRFTPRNGRGTITVRQNKNESDANFERRASVARNSAANR